MGCPPEQRGHTDATIGAFAVCGKVHGYRVVKGKPFAVTHGLDAGSFAACPAPTVPISGGVFSGSKSVFVNFLFVQVRAQVGRVREQQHRGRHHVSGRSPSAPAADPTAGRPAVNQGDTP